LRKKDFSPSILDFGPVQFFLARHFGFCYGVENAIEISYKAIEENPDRRVFLLSQMIHNQEVNNDLQSRGIKFIMDTDGHQYIPWSDLSPADIVIIPAFGTTVEIERLLLEKGLEVQKYNTTCPFVEKVWNRSEKLSLDNYTIIIHGKPNHEETRATFSHSAQRGHALVIRDLTEARLVGDFIKGISTKEELLAAFAGRYTKLFNPDVDLSRIGVVNQTTMLATETQAIADYLKGVMIEKYGGRELSAHFADTRDTLCYATNDNQDATYKLLETDADLALVVGGYNSSNTSHIVELCERRFPTYFINSDVELKSRDEIHHFNIHDKKKVVTENYLPEKNPIRIVLTSGASCPDTLVDRVLLKVRTFFENPKTVEKLMHEFDRN
jgi:4-hydroxy-3-methylbut-2-enyl diphosphate reductase